MLKADNISFSYNGRSVIKDLSVEIPAGSFTAVGGLNGSGKTTLLKALYGLLDVESGQITWKGDRVTGPSRNLIPGHHSMRMVTQNADVKQNMTVIENLEICFKQRSTSYIRERSDQIIQRVGLSDHTSKKPHELSGGQNQRLRLARVLAEPPDVLLMDEPFSQIDKHSAFQLLNYLDELRANKDLTIIYVSHDPDFILHFANTLHILHNGNIIRSGSPYDLHYTPQYEAVAGITGLYSKVNGRFLRPDQLSLEKGNNAKVIRSFPSYRHFIIQLDQDNKPVYVKHNKSLKPGELRNISITTS